MIAPKTPTNESKRLDEVFKHQILDTLPEEEFDAITDLCSRLLDVPISLITILDETRNFLKSHHGIPFNESPRDISFCGHAIASDQEIFIIEDARIDERFHDNPLVAEHQAVFYAGVPLKSSSGFKLGTLCIYDRVPRKLTDEHKYILQTLALQGEKLLELKLKNNQLLAAKEKIADRNEFLERYANHVCHDIKSPLNNVISLLQLLKKDTKNVISDKSHKYLNYIGEAAETLKSYINEILVNYKEGSITESNETIDVEDFFGMIKSLLPNNNETITYPDQEYICRINKAVLSQVLVNLIDNGLKYSHSKAPRVDISYQEKETLHHFQVSDNGRGIATKDLSNVFKLRQPGTKDKHGNVGHGIGLYAVKQLINKSGGTIKITSELNKGTTVSFTLPNRLNLESI